MKAICCGLSSKQCYLQDTEACINNPCYDCRAMLPSSEENCSAEDIQFVAIKAARAAGNVLLEYARSGFRIEHKTPINLVTDADHAAEQCIIDCIRAEFPTHRILAEERGAGPQQASRYQWVIDPLDGTTNFFTGSLLIVCPLEWNATDVGLLGWSTTRLETNSSLGNPVMGPGLPQWSSHFRVHNGPSRSCAPRDRICVRHSRDPEQ